MEAISLVIIWIFVIAFAVIQILMIVKFFQISQNVRKIKEEQGGTLELSDKTIAKLAEFIQPKHGDQNEKSHIAVKAPEHKPTLIVPEKVSKRVVDTSLIAKKAALEVSDEILAFIKSGNIQGARHYFMTKRGMTLSQADAEIQEIKVNLEN